MKKITLSTALVSVFLLILFTLSCKKEESTESESFLQNAKTWYLNATAKSNLEFKSSENRKEGIKQELNWNSANVYSLEDGNDVVGVPMKVNLTNGDDAKGSYMLFIGKLDDEFKSLVIYNEKEDYFNGTFTNAQIQTVYKDAMIAIDAHKKKATNVTSNHGGKVISQEMIPQPPVCIDWYWMETTYDYQGNIIDYTENYLYTICYENGSTPPGGGGSVGGAPDDAQALHAIHTDGDEGVTEGDVNEVVINGIPTRDWSTSWRFGKGEYAGYTFYGYSTELCKMKYIGGAWQWDTVTNQSYYTAGSRPNGTDFVKDGYAVNYYSTYADVQFTSHIAYINITGPSATSPKSKFLKINKR